MTIVWVRSANFGGASTIWHALRPDENLQTQCRKIDVSVSRSWFRLNPEPLKRCKTCAHMTREYKA